MDGSGRGGPIFRSETNRLHRSTSFPHWNRWEFFFKSRIRRFRKARPPDLVTSRNARPEFSSPRSGQKFCRDAERVSIRARSRHAAWNLKTELPTTARRRHRFGRETRREYLRRL